MKVVACLIVTLVAVAWSQEAKDKEDKPNVYQRLIPADVLRGKESPL